MYADDLFADEALKFVTENKTRPFFLYWSMVVPHANNERTRALSDGAEVPGLRPLCRQGLARPGQGPGRDDHPAGRLRGPHAGRA